MYLFLIVIIVAICVLLGMIVLIQNPKGGGLVSNFSSQSQLMGVKKTGDFLEKGTWVLAIALIVFSLAMNVAAKGGSSKDETQQFKDQIKKASQPSATTPAAPAPATPPLGAPVKAPVQTQPKPKPAK